MYLFSLRCYITSIYKKYANLDRSFAVYIRLSQMPPKYEFKASEIVNRGKINEETLNQLKAWCQKEAFAFVTDEQLVHFLISCNNVPEDAQKTIRTYFKCKSNGPEFFRSIFFEDEDVQKAVNVVDIALIPRRSPNDEVVFFGRLSDTCYHNFNLGCLAKVVIMLIEMSIRREPTDGLIAVIDMDGAGLRHLTRVQIGVVQKLFQYVQEGLNCKISEIHILNTVNFMDKIILIIKPFIKKELFEAIKFHPVGANLDQIFENLPKTCIPGDYGGVLPELKILSRETYAQVSSLRSFYSQLEEQVVLFEKAQK